MTDAVRTEPYPRRVRGVVGHETVVDSKTALLLLEEGHRPVWYFPPDDVRADLLKSSGTRTTCPRKGEASYWDLHVGDRVIENAAWSYQDPIAGREDIADRMAFYWNKLDRWFEEDDEVFVHPRDPYSRVDVLNSSRHIRVELDGVLLAETTRPRLLFETGLPMRTYIPEADVRMELLGPTVTTTQCPYKGVASYWSVRLVDQVVDDLAWTYRFPIPECPKIEGMIAFFDERVDVIIDGERQTRPVTVWSRR